VIQLRVKLAFGLDTSNAHATLEDLALARVIQWRRLNEENEE
jgi:hypothetical protein